jgi:GNAT superfamily N-acetyltransferase
MESKADSGGAVIIRPLVAKDTKQVAALCSQLGYPSTPEQVRGRLDRMIQDGDGAIFVAHEAGGQVVGWVHAYVRRLLEVEQHIEIGGLVVEKDHRCRGVGRMLMEQAEAWARHRSCEAVYVRSSVLRKGAHRFYQGIGYEQTKTLHLFVKELKDPR